MRHPLRDLALVALTAVVVVGLLQAVPPTSAQTTDFRAARLQGTTTPDLNGIWQAVNAANWDLKAHVARPALATAPVTR